jgi:hypothetical protein
MGRILGRLQQTQPIAQSIEHGLDALAAGCVGRKLEIHQCPDGTRHRLSHIDQRRGCVARLERFEPASEALTCGLGQTGNVHPVILIGVQRPCCIAPTGTAA